MICDRCKECGVADKFEPPSGHTKSGWCPVRQRFAEGVAHRRLRDLNVSPRELSADACAFLERVRSGNYVEVSKELVTKPELILMCVPAAPAYLVAADPQTPPKWTWSVLHERPFGSATTLLMIAPWKPSACSSHTAWLSGSTSTRRSRAPLTPGQLLCTRHAGAVVVLQFKDFSTRGPILLPTHEVESCPFTTPAAAEHQRT